MLSLQQSQQQPQQQQGQPQSQQTQQIPPPPPQNGQDYTLSNVLHFLQTEWRRYERDRNEWEIERAEMRARIALLEGERRSFENVKLDLMRRIKMLEYALRVERSKQLNQSSSSQPVASVPPAKLASIQAQAQKDDQSPSVPKEESSGSSPRSEDSPLPESRVPNGLVDRNPPTRQNSVGGLNWGNLSQLPGKAPPGRDPKSRARSRDYLKQCLQEITYLTSPQAMNPLPNRPLVASLTNQANPNQGNPANPPIPLALPNVPSFEQMTSAAYNGRPRKVLPEGGKDFPPMMNGMNLMTGSGVSPAGSGTHGQVPSLERPNALAGSVNQQSAPSPVSSAPPSETASSEDKKEFVEEPRQLTAIFRPDDAGEWKEKLRLAHEASLAAGGSGAGGWEKGGEEEIKDDDGEVEDEEVLDEQNDSSEGSKWKPKRTLRNHLDAVRALAFHPTDLCLATGGDDCTVKIWRMDVAALASSAARPTTEVEPHLTLRGHSAAITRLVHSPSKNLLYSASLDSSIRVWAVPGPSHTPYAPYDETLHRDELIGHTDAVWDLALARDESTLISCGAEGQVKVWDVSAPSGSRGSLKLSWGYNGIDSEKSSQGGEQLDETEVMLREDGETGAPGATAVEAIKADLKKVAVAYQNAVVKIFELETGKEVMKLPSDVSYDGTSRTQINRVISHPTMPLLVTAHEDKYIRIFDLTTGQCTHSMLVHLDGVTSLSIDASGFSLVSGSHDCSIRFWDLLGSHSLLQEMTLHREKAREGVLDVEFHPTLPIMASAGADGVVKLYASS